MTIPPSFGFLYMMRAEPSEGKRRRRWNIAPPGV
jgi:hypothetical protein